MQIEKGTENIRIYFIPFAQAIVLVLFHKNSKHVECVISSYA